MGSREESERGRWRVMILSPEVEDKLSRQESETVRETCKHG
jgi:hypothetical protein